MNTQQHSLNNLTTAIYDLIKVIKSSSIVAAEGSNGKPLALQAEGRLTSPEHKPSPTSNTSYQDNDVTSSQIQKRQKLAAYSDRHSQSISSSSTQKQAQSLSKPKSRSSKVRARINRCIDAIMAFNDTPHRPHADKWAISVAILRQLANCGQSAAYAVYNSRKGEIETHNQFHQLDYLHNRKGQNSPNIEDVIHLD